VGARDWLGSALKPGKHSIVFDFKYDGPGFGKAAPACCRWTARGFRQSMPHSIAFLMAIDESFDVGVDSRTGVDDSYKLPFQFTGKIDKLTFKLGPTADLKRRAADISTPAPKRATSRILVDLRASKDARRSLLREEASFRELRIY